MEIPGLALDRLAGAGLDLTRPLVLFFTTVVEQARMLSVRIDWRTHARVGVPVTGLTLALAAGRRLVRAAFFGH